MKVNEVVKELRALSNEELEAKIKEAKKELFDLRLKKSTNKLENTASISNTKRTIAQVKTVITEKEVENA